MPVKKQQKVAAPAIAAGTRQELWMQVILAAFTLALYANTLGHGFANDDIAVVQANNFTHEGLAGIPKMLGTFYWAGYWDYNDGLYRPLSLIGFAIQWQFFKDAASWYHVVNVLLYVTTILLLFSTLRRMLSDYPPLLAFVVSLAFAAHPTHTEVVANIKSQDELLCFIFALLTVQFVLKNVDRHSPKNVFLSCACFFLALLAKEGALVFLATIPLILYVFRDTKPKAVVREMAPLLVVSALWFALHQWATHTNAPPLHAYNLDDNSLVGARTFFEREATAFYMMGKYLLLLIFPHPLSYDYSYSEIPLTSFASAKAIAPLVVCVVLGFIAIRELKKENLVSFGILFFFITISMTSNVIVLIGATMADRFLYVPSLGFCFVVTYFWVRFLDIPDGKSASLSFASHKYFPVYILLALYSYKTYTRNEDWHDNLSLFTADVRSSPGSARAHYNAGTELLTRFVVPNPDKDADARKNAIRAVISELETAVTIDSTAFLYHLNLASAYSYDENYAKAAEQASIAIGISGADPRPFVVLGSAYGSMKQYGKALEVFKRGLDIDPSNSRLNQLTGKTYEVLGDTAAAKRYYGLAHGKLRAAGN